MRQSPEHIKIASRYVSSLFQVVETKKDRDSVAKDLQDLDAMLADSEALRHFINSPVLSESDQINAVTALAKKAKFSSYTQNLLNILLENRRLSVLPSVISEAMSYLNEQSGILPVSVTTARKLTDTEAKTLQKDIQQAVGQDVSLKTQIDEALIGGVVVQLGSTLIDGSIKAKLDKIERQLTQKAA